MEKDQDGRYKPLIELECSQRQEDDAKLAGSCVGGNERQPGADGHQGRAAQVGGIVTNPPAQNPRAASIMNERHARTSPPEAVEGRPALRVVGAQHESPIPG